MSAPPRLVLEVDGRPLDVEVPAGATVSLLVDGVARIGVMTDDVEDCGDPTLVVWQDDAVDGEGRAVVSLHLARFFGGEVTADEVATAAAELERLLRP